MQAAQHFPEALQETVITVTLNLAFYRNLEKEKKIPFQKEGLARPHDSHFLGSAEQTSFSKECLCLYDLQLIGWKVVPLLFLSSLISCKAFQWEADMLLATSSASVSLPRCLAHCFACCWKSVQLVNFLLNRMGASVALPSLSHFSQCYAESLWPTLTPASKLLLDGFTREGARVCACCTTPSSVFSHFSSFYRKQKGVWVEGLWA